MGSTEDILRADRLTRAKFSRKDLLRFAALGGASLATSSLLFDGASLPVHAEAASKGKLTGPLNVLAWDGYDNPAVVKLFKDTYGVDLHVKIASSDNSQLDQLRAGTQQFDVANPDNDWVQLFAQTGLIQPLNRSDYPHLNEMFGPFKSFAPHYYNNHLFGVPIRWGINGIVHYPNVLSVHDAQNAWSLWDKKLKQKIGMTDWFDLYILLVDLYMGNKKPWTVSGNQLDAVTKKLLQIKPNVRSLAQDTGTIITDMANKDIGVVWGASSNDTAAGLRQSGHNVHLTIPKQGGAIWTEALVISKNTPHYETARTYLNFMTSPKVQAMMAWNKQFKIAVCNAKVLNLLNKHQITILNIDKADELLSHAVLSRTPVARAAWLKAWEHFKAA